MTIATTRLRTSPGPLEVSTINPRYFTHRGDRTGQAVYLTGSHIWDNLHDGTRDDLMVERERALELRAPFVNAPAVLYLSRVDRE